MEIVLKTFSVLMFLTALIPLLDMKNEVKKYLEYRDYAFKRDNEKRKLYILLDLQCIIICLSMGAFIWYFS